MENKIYVACYSTGEYDSYDQVNVFASTDKKKVQKWVKKANYLIKEYKKLYEKYSEDDGCMNWIKDEYIEYCFNKWIKIIELNEAFIVEIERR